MNVCQQNCLTIQDEPCPRGHQAIETEIAYIPDFGKPHRRAPKVSDCTPNIWQRLRYRRATTPRFSISFQSTDLVVFAHSSHLEKLPILDDRQKHDPLPQGSLPQLFCLPCACFFFRPIFGTHDQCRMNRPTAGRSLLCIMNTHVVDGSFLIEKNKTFSATSLFGPCITESARLRFPQIFT